VAKGQTEEERGQRKWRNFLMTSSGSPETSLSENNRDIKKKKKKKTGKRTRRAWGHQQTSEKRGD